MKKLIFFISCLILSLSPFGQNVAVNNSSAPPDQSAILDISSSTKGMLVPRMTRAQRIAIEKPAKGLLVYQTDSDSAFYFNAGNENLANWVSIQSQLTGWGTKGNSGTNPSVNFIGTTDASPVRFRYNNINAGIIDSASANTGLGFRNMDIGSGQYNTAFGYETLSANSNGGANTAIGGLALYTNNNGQENTAIGQVSMATNENGSYNTALGGHSLFHSDGSYNTALGYGAVQGRSMIQNATAVGARAQVDCSNCMVLGSSSSRGSSDINVGISETNPAYPLSFAQTLGDKISLFGGAGSHFGLGLQTNLLQIHTHTSSADIAFGYGSSGSFTETMRIKGNGNVGIGVLQPSTKLHIKDGNSGFAGVYQPGLVFEGDGHRYLNFITPDANESGVFFGRASRIDHGGLVYNNFVTPNGLQFRTNGNFTRMIIDGSGNVGINTTAPSQRLTVAGNICATGSIASCSDIRYKINILPLCNALTSILALHGIYYNWDTEKFPELEFTDQKQIGFSAQEVEKILPELVSTGSDGYKSVDYGKLTPILVEAIKEQQMQIGKLEKLVNELIEANKKDSQSVTSNSEQRTINGKR
jgi:hypothetical protein